MWSKTRRDKDWEEVPQVEGSTRGAFRYRTASAAQYECCGIWALRWVINEDVREVCCYARAPSLLGTKTKDSALASDRVDQ